MTMTPKQHAMLLRLDRQRAVYPTGTEVRLVKDLEALGFATLVDNGSLKVGLGGREDGERWYATITDLGRAEIVHPTMGDIPDFKDRYLITSVRSGEILDYARMLDLVMKKVRERAAYLKAVPVRQRRSIAEQALHDERFMNSVKSMIPARIVDRVVEYIWNVGYQRANPS